MNAKYLRTDGYGLHTCNHEVPSEKKVNVLSNTGGAEMTEYQ